MHYLTQAVAIALTVFILSIWISHKRLHTLIERVFLYLIIVALISAVLDIICQFAIAPYPISMSNIETLIFIKLYYLSIIAFLYGIGLYIISKIENVSNKNKNKNIMLVIGIVLGVVMCLLPVDYTYHPDCSMMVGIESIACLGIVLLVCIAYEIILFLNKKNISNWSIFVISYWNISYAVGFVVQYLTIDIYHLPLVSINIAVGIMFLYLCNENPGSKYDYETNCFYYETFVEYSQELINAKSNNACMMLNIKVKNIDNYKYIKKIYSGIVNDKKYENVKFYKGISNELYTISDNLEILKDIENTALKVINDIEKNSNQIKLVPIVVIVPSISVVSSYKVLKAVFEAYGSKNIREYEGFEEIVVTEEIINYYHNVFKTVEEIEYAVRSDNVIMNYQIIKDNSVSDIFVEAFANIKMSDGSILSTNDYYEIAVKYELLKDIRAIKLKALFNTISNIISKNNILNTVFIHTSVQELEDEEYYLEFLSAFNDNDAVLSKTCLSITNIDTISNKEVMLKNINELQKHGVKFAVSGFGSGEANLNYFVDLPIQFVKFDKLISDNASEDEHALMIMKDITNLAHSLNFNVIVVGKETEKLAKVMHVCDINKLLDDEAPMINDVSLQEISKAEGGIN